MKIYFFSSEKKVNQRQQQIVDLLQSAGAQVFSNLSIAKNNLPEAEVKKVEDNGETVLSRMDGLVVDASKVSNQLGYLVAYAISHQNPVLYLLERGKRIDPTLKSLQDNKKSGRFFFVKFYSDGLIEKQLSDFLKKVEVLSGVEAPLIKFTLRIPPMIDRYLQWKTHNTHLTKADFLRKILVDEVIKKDEKFIREVEGKP